MFDFDSALVREPAQSVIRGLTSQPGPRPSFEDIRREHCAYVRALEECGLAVEVLAPLEDFPDSLFVEDPALVFGDGAILLRPGAPTRFAEVERIDDALLRRFPRVLRMKEGFADGGDMLLTPSGMLIGLSRRTNRAGASELATLLEELDIRSRIVDTPAGTLHLKSACSLVNVDQVLCTASLGASRIFEEYRTLIVPQEEAGAANSLRLNDTILVGEEFPRTLDLLRNEGLRVRPLPVHEIGKLDAGLSCMSLRWKASG